MSKISKKDKRMLEKFRAYLIAERKNRVLPTDGMTEIPLKTGTLQIPKGAICVTTCKLRDADQAGVRLQGVRQLLRGDKPGGARRQQGYSETLRLQRL